MSPHRAQRSPSTWRSPLARRARSPCRPLTGQRRPAPTACQHCSRAAPACTWGMPLTLRQRGALTLGLIPGRTHAARPRKFCRCRAECLVGGPHLQRVYAESPIFRSAPAPVCPSPHIAPASRTFGTTKPSRLRCFAYATTVGCRTLASFTRTQTLVAPMTPVEPRKASTFDSADSRDASATLSSKSSIIASAPLASAFVSARDDRRGRTTLAHVGSTFGGPPVQGQGVASRHAWHDRGVSQLQALEIDDAIQGCQ